MHVELAGVAIPVLMMRITINKLCVDLVNGMFNYSWCHGWTGIFITLVPIDWSSTGHRATVHKNALCVLRTVHYTIFEPTKRSNTHFNYSCSEYLVSGKVQQPEPAKKVQSTAYTPYRTSQWVFKEHILETFNYSSHIATVNVPHILIAWIWGSG